MADGCLNFAEHERARLNTEIEALQAEIRLHNETKAAWDTIVHNAGNESDVSCLDVADSAKQRLDSKIASLQEKIRVHNQTIDAWDMIERNAGSQSRIYHGTTYERGEDGHWHLQRLSMEIEDLQEEIRLHNECMDAWDLLVRNAESESRAAYLELANTAKQQLDREIEAALEKINRRVEIKDAWDTIVRNADSEMRTYHGATYVMGEDNQWHLQQAGAGESNAVEQETDDLDLQTTHAVSKVFSTCQVFLDACKKTFNEPKKNIDLRPQGKEQFLSLGLR